MGTHYRGRRSERRALDTYIKLQRAADTVTGRTARRVKQAGLTESQFGVLEMLLHLGPLQQSVIGDKLLKSGGNVTVVIDHLEQRELIRRVANPDDRRCLVVHLTESGRMLINEIFPQYATSITDTMSALSAEEQEILGTLCRKLGHGVSTGQPAITRTKIHSSTQGKQT